MVSRSVRSRRAVLGLGVAGVAGAAVAAKMAGSGNKAPAGPAHPAAHRRTVSENSQAGDPDWPIRHFGAPDAMLGYAGQASVLPGEPITLYASTTARSFRVKAYRMGWYGGARARLVWRSATVPGHRQRKPTLIRPTNTVEAVWGPSLTIPTHDWPEGSYLLRLDAESGAQRYVPVTVRSASTAGKTVIKNSVSTWQAYNTWGGYDLYNGPGGIADYDNRALAVSLDRPYDASGAYMFLYHERKLIELAERLGLPLAYLTNLDIGADPHLLTGPARCSRSATTSTGRRRSGPTSPRPGTPARTWPSWARTAASGGPGWPAAGWARAGWSSATRRAIPKTRCTARTTRRSPATGGSRPAPTRSPRLPARCTNRIRPTPTSSWPRADSWLFAGTGVQTGTKFTGLVGIEYDRVNPVYHVERPIQVLSHSPLTCRGVNSYADSAYYTHRSGAGVFNTGTMRWVASSARPYPPFGLNRHTAQFVTRVNANVLRGFADGPAAAKHPAHDNLDAMHEWPGDPMAAQHDLWPPVRL